MQLKCAIVLLNLKICREFFSVWSKKIKNGAAISIWEAKHLF